MKKFDVRPPFLLNDIPIPGSVAWTQGLQLMPQHFQVSDAYYLNSVAKSVWAANPYYWGFHSLKIDQVALAQGVVRILNASGVFPCGLVFDTTEEYIEYLDLKNENLKFQYLALKVDVEANSNFISGFEYAISKKRKFSDIYNQEEPLEISLRVPKIKVVNFDVANHDPFSLPLAKIISVDPCVLDSNYHPAAPFIIGDSQLYTNLGEFFSRIKAQLTALMIEPYPLHIPRNYSNNLINFGNSIIPNLVRLEGGVISRTLSLPEIYNSTLQLVGSILSFSGNLPRNIPLYNHLDPYSSFREVFSLVDPYLGKFISSKSVWQKTPPLVKDNYWCFPVNINLTLKVTFLVKFDNAPLSIVSNWIEKVLICWESEYNKCRESRVKGFARTIQKDPEFPISDNLNSNFIAFDVHIEKVLYSTENFNLIIERPGMRNGNIISAIDLMSEVN